MLKCSDLCVHLNADQLKMDRTWFFKMILRSSWLFEVENRDFRKVTNSMELKGSP